MPADESKPVPFITGSSPLCVRLSYLRDHAYKWIKPYLKDFMGHDPEDRDDATDGIFGSYAELCKRIEPISGKIDEDFKAEQGLVALD